MTCLEAQSKIIAYIEHKLDRNEKMDFLRHMRQCKDCKEELNIYYTMIEGMRQLDENEPLSKNFENDLNKRMEQELNLSRTKKDAIRCSFLLLVIVVGSFIVVGYVNFLHFLEDQEQQQLKEQQGMYYYYETFEPVLFEPYDDRITFDITSDTGEKEMSFYKKIRRYHDLQD